MPRILLDSPDSLPSSGGACCGSMKHGSHMVSRKRQPLPALGQDSVDKQQKRKGSQPLAALEQGSGEKQEKRSQAGMRVQYFGQRLSCTSMSLARALKKTLKETRASRTTWTAKHWNFVVREKISSRSERVEFC